MKILVTGGAGFIGSAVIRQALAGCDHRVVNLDKLTYAGSLDTAASWPRDERYSFERVDIADGPAVERVFRAHQPDAVIHLAAESHVDRSISAPVAFAQANVVGTATLLDASCRYHGELEGRRKKRFRFVHVSTDEVYGSLGADGAFTETSPYDPSSPYAASKAASDHFVRAAHRTFGLPVIVTHGSNTFGPFQFPEKLIPVVIINARRGRPIPVYGTGRNVRDWIHVDDHAQALYRVLEAGRVGETYTIGGRCERSNLEIVDAICRTLDELAPTSPVVPHAQLIRFVADRPGHDQRYATDCGKLERELGWSRLEPFDAALRRTVAWYLQNESWWSPLLASAGGNAGAAAAMRVQAA